MTTSLEATRAEKPAHVPAELVRNFDYILDEGIAAGPHARMAEIAETMPPLFWTPHHGGHWVINSRRLLAEATLNPDRFSNFAMSIPPVEGMPQLIPLMFDPPEHSVYRIPANRYFSPKAISALEPSIRRMTDELIDAVVDKGGCEFLHAVAEPLPVVLFMRMAGLPDDRIEEFRILAGQSTASPDPAVKGGAIQQIGALLAEVIQARLAEPKDDLTTHIITADYDGRKLTFPEMVNYMVLLFIGGLETVVNSIAFNINYLATHPDIQASMRADPGSLPVMIEELLRLHGIAMSSRRATQDTRLGDVELKQDDRVLMLVPAVNYDPQAFDDARAFCPGRSGAHVSFNMGPHRCVGAPLARLELRVFLEQWLARIPPFRRDPAKPPTYHGGLSLSVGTLSLVWDA